MPPVPQSSLSHDDSAASRRPRVQVAVANQTDACVDEARLTAGVTLALAGARCAAAEVSVAIVDDATIHRLNRQFLEHDYATDVLSFTLSEPPRLEGEIVASIDTARREAAAIGWPADDELLLYVVHGALHLAGQRDEEPEDAAAMRRAERAVLEQLGVQAAPDDPRWSDKQPAGHAQEGPS